MINRLSFIAVLIVLLGCTVVGCSQDSFEHPVTPESEVIYSKQLDDLDPGVLIGLDYSEVFPLVYTEEGRSQWTNVEPMTDLNGLKYQLRTWNFTRALFPEISSSEYSVQQQAPFTVIASCSKYDQEDDSYTINVGYIQTKQLTSEILQKAQSGEYTTSMYERGNCNEPSGSVVPLSRVGSDK